MAAGVLRTPTLFGLSVVMPLVLALVLAEEDMMKVTMISLNSPSQDGIYTLAVCRCFFREPQLCQSLCVARSLGCRRLV